MVGLVSVGFTLHLLNSDPSSLKSLSGVGDKITFSPLIISPSKTLNPEP